MRFAACVESLREAGVTALLEIGPHPTLLSLAGRALPGAAWLTAASLRRERDDRREMLGSLGKLYVRGAAVRWDAVNAGRGRRRGDLPTYPFQRERHWGVPDAAATAAGNVHGHPLLGERRELATGKDTHVWQRTVSTETHPWLRDHRVQGSAVVPATAYIEMALASGAEVFGQHGLSVSEIENLKPIVLHDGVARELQTVLVVDSDGSARFSVHSRLDGAAAGSPWITHTTARLSRIKSIGPATSALAAIDAARTRCTREIDGPVFYAALAAKGNQWGPAFQGMDRVWVGENEAVGKIGAVPAVAGDVGRYLFHPALADSCAHVLVATVPLEATSNPTGGAVVGGGLGEMRFHKSPASAALWAHATVRPAAEGEQNVVRGDLRVFDETGDLISETLDARLWYLDDAAGSDMLGASDDLFYEVAWEARAMESPGERASASGRLLVFGDRAGVGAAPAAARPGSVLVEPGERFSTARATVRLNSDADYRELFGTAGAFTAIVHLWAVDAKADELDELAGALAAGPASIVRVVQALVSSPLTPHPRIWIVSAGAQAAVDTDLVSSPSGATVWGIGRTLAAEHAELWGGLVDLDLTVNPATAARLLEREVSGSDAEDKIAHRGDRRFVPRLRRRPMRAPVDQVMPRGDGTYLVTGGLGGVGFAMARRLVERGARHLLLIGRTPLPPRESWSDTDPRSRLGRIVAAIADMERSGVRVEIAALDIASKGPLEDCLDARRARGEPAIRGVIHAAGVLQFKALVEQDQAGLVSLFEGKVQGAWRLQRVLTNEPLDCFVVCSSSSALLRSPFLGGYAAANSFLDAFAHYRKKRGEPALSVNWGTWGEVGMAADGGQSMSGTMLRGVGVISTSTGLSALEELLDAGATQAAVMPIDWAELSQSYPALTADPFLRAVASSPSSAGRETSGPRFSLDAFHEAKPAVRSALAGEYLRREAARVLGLATEAIDAATPLSSLGFDSLMAVQLKNRIETDLKVVVQMVLYRARSVDQLTTVVLDAVRTAGRDLVGDSQATAAFEEGSL